MRSLCLARLLQRVRNHGLRSALRGGHLFLAAALQLTLVLGDALDNQVGEQNLVPVDHAEQLRSLHSTRAG
jgi:hypothetical protein